MAEYKTNPFISTKISGNSVTAKANKYAIAQTITEIALVIGGKEANIDKNRSFPGSDNDVNYRKLVDLLIQAKRATPSVLNHPYISIIKRIIHISGDIDVKIRNYAETNSIPEQFNMEEYLNLLCERDINGNILGLKKILSAKDTYGNFSYDRTKKDNLSAAFDSFFATLDSLSNSTIKANSSEKTPTK